MKKRIHTHLVFLVIFSMFFIGMGNAQTAKKEKLRIKANYVKITDSLNYIDIVTTAKIDKKHTNIPNIELSIFNIKEEEKKKIGSVITNSKGKCKFYIKNFNAITPDSSSIYNFNISFKGNDNFKKAKKNISFKDATINAKIIVKDSTNFITATLKESHTDSLLSDESLTVQIKRLINPLKIGKQFNLTDENGTIIVPIQEGIPGVDGILTMEVVLEDHDEYGTVKTVVKAPVGVPIIEDTTFNKRTMWSSRDKTPWFILIFTNALIISVWGIIVYLVINLFRIKKS